MRVLEIGLDTITRVVTYYDKIRVYSATTQNGTYSLLGTISGLINTTSLYYYIDNDGNETTFYKYSLYKSTAVIAETAQIAVPQLYARAEDLKIRLNENTSTTDDAIFWRSVVAATRQIRNYCGQEFSQTIETRYFEGNNLGKGRSDLRGEVLEIDQCVSLTAIALDYSGGQTTAPVTTLTLNTNCYLYPQEAPGRGFPYFGLCWIEGSTLTSVSTGYYWDRREGLYWPRGYQAIRLTGTWGWPVDSITRNSVPADVEEATLQLAARIYKGRDNAYSKQIGTNAIGTLTVSSDLFNSDTKSLLNPYVKRKL